MVRSVNDGNAAGRADTSSNGFSATTKLCKRGMEHGDESRKHACEGACEAPWRHACAPPSAKDSYVQRRSHVERAEPVAPQLQADKRLQLAKRPQVAQRDIVQRQTLQAQHTEVTERLRNRAARRYRPMNPPPQWAVPQERETGVRWR